jgi:hypothetical protein
MPPHSNGPIYEFGAFRLAAAAQVLSSKSDGRSIPLTPRVYDTLLFLVEPQRIARQAPVDERRMAESGRRRKQPGRSSCGAPPRSSRLDRC